ncbi:MAG TPA: hypothetical protein ENK23_04585 [Sorangium sp.]|nr:hypothetical protein [Sorangium sp.]
MSVPNFNEWTPQRPNTNFADSTVRLMANLPCRHSRGHARRKWLGLLTLAAILGGSSTWAMWAQHDAQARPVELYRTIGPVTANASANAVPPQRQADIIEVAPLPARAPRPMKRHAINKAPRPTKTSIAKEETKAPKHVLQPRCGCDIDAIICGCLE